MKREETSNKKGTDGRYDSMRFYRPQQSTSSLLPGDEKAKERWCSQNSLRSFSAISAVSTCPRNSLWGFSPSSFGVFVPPNGGRSQWAIRRSCDAAKECSPRRKPRDGNGSKEKAPQGRKRPLPQEECSKIAHQPPPLPMHGLLLLVN